MNSKDRSAVNGLAMVHSIARLALAGTAWPLPMVDA